MKVEPSRLIPRKLSANLEPLIEVLMWIKVNLLTLLLISGVGGGGAGGASAPLKFWCGENPGKVPENSGKIRGNLGKLLITRAKMAPNLLWFEKIGAQRVQNHMKTFFSFQKRSSWENTRTKKWLKNFSGKFGEIRAKILRTPKHLPAPTPMLLIPPLQIFHCRLKKFKQLISF